MKTLLVDADSKIPNLALMKLSMFYKGNADLIKLGISYYPNKKPKEKIKVNTNGYDIVFCSTIFPSTLDFIEFSSTVNVIVGGTGHSLKRVLDEDVDKLEPDYTIYPSSDRTYDFITRGCIRNCSFCFVPEKEGSLYLYKNVEKIIEEAKSRGHNVVEFLDNNILAYEKHIQVLDSLIQSQLKINFNQGLDIRLLNKENQKALSDLKYDGEYVFAFDSYKFLDIMDKKLPLIKLFGDWKVKLYLYVNPRMEISETVQRIKWCLDNEILPYVMRDVSCWSDRRLDFYTDIAAYANQPAFCKKISFLDFLDKRHTKQNRIDISKKLWEDNL